METCAASRVFVMAAERKESPDEPCEFCSEGVNRLGTRVDLEVFYEDFRYAGYPAFCSWEHCAEWFSLPRPDFNKWEESPDTDGEGFQYGGLIFVVTILALSLYGLVSLVQAII